MPDELARVLAFLWGLLPGWVLGRLFVPSAPPKAEEDPGPFQRGRFVSFNSDAPLRRPPPLTFAEPEPEAWKPDKRTLMRLLRYIVTEYGDGLPEEGVPLTVRACAEYDITRATWQRLVRFVLAPPPAGYRRADGIVYLGRRHAARLVERARRAGRM